MRYVAKYAEHVNPELLDTVHGVVVATTDNQGAAGREYMEALAAALNLSIHLVKTRVRRQCDRCGEWMEVSAVWNETNKDFTSRRKWCSDACRVAAHRDKNGRNKTTKEPGS